MCNEVIVIKEVNSVVVEDSQIQIATVKQPLHVELTAKTIDSNIVVNPSQTIVVEDSQIQIATVKQPLHVELNVGLRGPAGQDGYTPVKGIDYFDGQDGYTPVKGIDYFDGDPGPAGQDGYTPVKGIDYFDGQDGYTPVKGIDYFDGQDGYTPVKGIDYFDGDQGPAGPGVAVGGTAGQVLSKIDSVDFNTQWVDVSSSGGDVSGPVSALDNSIAVYDDITGKLIKDGNIRVFGPGSVATFGSILGDKNIKLEVSGTFIPARYTTGASNIMIGDGAAAGWNGQRNVCIGRTTMAGNYLNAGDDNVVIGDQAGVNIGSSSTRERENVCIGKNAGDYGEITYCTLIGTRSNKSGSISPVSYSTALGYNAQIVKSNQMVLGGTNIVETLLRGTVIAPKIMLTPEGGYAVLLTNRTGAASVKGTIISTSPDYDNAVRLCPVDSPAPVGIIYETGIADGSNVWVVVSGIAEVLFVNNVERNWLARMSRSDDTTSEAGKGWGEILPSPPFATDKHFMEFGHILETKTAGSLTKCLIHFN